MPNERLSRDDRFQAGRDRNEAEYRRGKSDRGNYPDWDRYGSYRDTERSRFGRDNGYVSDDRANWTTDDLGYSEFGDAGYRRTYADNSFDDRERGYARQYNFGDRDERREPRRDFIERAGDEVASWFGDEDAARRRRTDQFRGKGPKGYVRSDERILDDVNDRLSDDPYLDASDIEVSVSSSEVLLTGFVSSRPDKRRAEDLAESVSGVSHVQNNVRVKTGDTAVDNPIM